jgi:type IV pilus assembly protein PilX
MKAMQQRGVSLIVVLIMLVVMLLGALAAVRMIDSGTLVAGNIARNEASAQAADVGVNSAFDDVRALIDENTNAGGWYFATRRADDAYGLPGNGVDWDNAREVVVGQYRVRYVIDRQCTVAPVTDPANQCLLREDKLDIYNAGGEAIDPPKARAFRITVRVTGPKNSLAWVQALATRG